MPGSGAPTSGPSSGYTGLFPANWDVPVTNRKGSAVAVGELVRWDITGSQAEVSTISTNLGDADHPGGNIVQSIVITSASAAGTVDILAHGFFGVVIDLLNDAGADNTRVLVRIEGYVEIANVLAADAVEAGEQLTCNALALGYADASGAKIIAVAANDKASGDLGADQISCWFSGYNGFGTSVEAYVPV